MLDQCGFYVTTDHGNQDDITEIIAHALWQAGYRGCVQTANQDEPTSIEDKRGKGVVDPKYVVLSIDPGFLDDNGFDGRWAMEHGEMQNCANQYWTCIASGLAMYDPVDDAFEKVGVPHLDDPDACPKCGKRHKDDLMGGEEAHLDDPPDACDNFVPDVDGDCKRCGCALKEHYNEPECACCNTSDSFAAGGDGSCCKCGHDDSQHYEAKQEEWLRTHPEEIVDRGFSQPYKPDHGFPFEDERAWLTYPQDDPTRALERMAQSKRNPLVDDVD